MYLSGEGIKGGNKMENEKYQTINKDLNKVSNYLDDLQTLLDWLKYNSVLTDDQHCFIRFDDGCYAWFCGGKSIQLTPGQAFALQRLGFVFEDTVTESSGESEIDHDLMAAVED